MRIQVLDPANSYKPIKREEVKSYLNGEAVKDEITLKVTPGKDQKLRIFYEEPVSLEFENKAGLASLGLSSYSDLYGYTWLSINDNKTKREAA